MLVSTVPVRKRLEYAVIHARTRSRARSRSRSHTRTRSRTRSHPVCRKGTSPGQPTATGRGRRGGSWGAPEADARVRIGVWVRGGPVFGQH